VRTSVGTVSVTGTSFRVQYAANADDTVAVSVYEGSVVLANEMGQRSLTAGQRAELQRGRPPTAAFDFVAALVEPGPEDARGETMLAQHRARIRQLERRVEELEQGAQATGSRAAAASVDSKRSYYRPTQEDLEAMAAQCRLNFDIPPLDAHDTPALIDKLEAFAATDFGLSPAERTRIQAMYAEFNERFTQQIRDLYVEATGDAAGATILSIDSMRAEITGKSDPRVDVEARRTIAEERAGLRPPSNAEQLPVERYYRLMVAPGGDLERELARIVGAERAADIRRATSGWPGKMSAGACEW
jgi:hypothetical protein